MKLLIQGTDEKMFIINEDNNIIKITANKLFKANYTLAVSYFSELRKKQSEKYYFSDPILFEVADGTVELIEQEIK